MEETTVSAVRDSLLILPIDSIFRFLFSSLVIYLVLQFRRRGRKERRNKIFLMNQFLNLSTRPVNPGINHGRYRYRNF